MSHNQLRRVITPADIILPAEYAPQRRALRQQLLAIKQYRRLEIGPVATCYFENFETMVHQINEMLYIEKGGPDSIADEIAAYGSLVPNGQELTATVMFEIDDAWRRKNFLARLGGIEETMFLRFGHHQIRGVAEQDLDRTTAEGKASAVQFLHFPFTPAQIKEFCQINQQIILGFDHPHYAHMTVMGENSRQALAKDFAEN